MILRKFLTFASLAGQQGHIHRQQHRCVSILNSLQSSPVLVSASRDVYTNLALEHWLYSNVRFHNKSDNLKDVPKDRIFNHPIILLWIDEPCVVIGRHQNPWIEATLGFVDRVGLKLARRHSGGGCVYHDDNNINVSVISDRRDFEKRQENLEFLAKTIEDSFAIKCKPNKRHDLVHADTGLKISGSAAKLGRYNCYHHFTVLVDTDKDVLYTAIRQKQQPFVQSNSSLSTRSQVGNLKQFNDELDVDTVLSAISNGYATRYGKPIEAKKSPPNKGDEAEFADLDKLKQELQSWDWIYGKTPKFRLEKCFPFVDGNDKREVKISVQINKGLFETIEIEDPLAKHDLSARFKSLVGTRFAYKDAMVATTKLIQIDDTSLSAVEGALGIELLYATFLLQMIHECNYEVKE